MQKGSLVRIPDPDYKRHPAYGGNFGTPSLLDRVRALLRFLPYLSVYIILSIIHREKLSKTACNSSSSAALSPLAHSLKQNGVAAVRLDPRDKQIISQQLEGLIETVRRKQKSWKKKTRLPWRVLLRKGFRVAYFAHENGRLRKDLYVHENDAPELFSSLRKALKSGGVLDAANEYLGRPLNVQFLRLTLREAKQSRGKKPFRELGDIASPTSHMHIDHVWTVKCILYIGEVNKQNGPFCYCLGSQKLHIGWLESQVRRANDRALLSSLYPKWRRLFSALPVAFQKKAKFGDDLIGDSPEVKSILNNERYFTSGDGDLIVFDDKGIHRGGLVDQGTRWALQIRLG